LNFNLKGYILNTAGDALGLWTHEGKEKKKATFNQRPNESTNETLVGIDDDGLNLFDF